MPDATPTQPEAAAPAALAATQPYRLPRECLRNWHPQLLEAGRRLGALPVWRACEAVLGYPPPLVQLCSEAAPVLAHLALAEPHGAGPAA